MAHPDGAQAPAEPSGCHSIYPAVMCTLPKAAHVHVNMLLFTMPGCDYPRPHGWEKTLVCPPEGVFSIITAQGLPSVLPSPLSDGPLRRHPPRRRPGSCVSSACSPGRSGCASSSAAGAAWPPWPWPTQPLAARCHKEGAGSGSAVT